MNELLPCPFCGGDAKIKKNKTVMVSCTECTASTFQLLRDPSSSIAAWNRRAKPASAEGWISVEDRLPGLTGRDDTPCVIEGRSIPATL